VVALLSVRDLTAIHGHGCPRCESTTGPQSGSNRCAAAAPAPMSASTFTGARSWASSWLMPVAPLLSQHFF
jgi:hypothetical protein